MRCAILSDDVLAGINKPVAEAVSLPRECYTDPEFFALEMRFVFEAGWVFVAPGSLISNAGDVFPTEVAGKPIVLVRQDDGAVRAFHNVCRHRGMVLVGPDSRCAPSLVCPYHGWTYRLDGRLARTPHYEGPRRHEATNISADSMSLAPVRCGLWHDWIFVDLSGKAVPLEEHVAPLAERYAAFDLGLLRLAGFADFELAANWKLPTENFREGYHLPWTHKFLNSVSSLEAHYSIVEERFAGQGSEHYDADAAGYGALPRFRDLPERWGMRAEYPSMLPNLWLGVHNTHVNVWGIFPVAPERTVQRVYSYVVGDEALRPECSAARELLVSSVRRTNLEDVGVIEGMQRGRRSPGYVDPRFSPYHERALHHLQRQVANAIAAGLARV